VPDIHLADALTVCEREGRVAFGSNALDFFSKYDAKLTGLEVFIFPSLTGSPKPQFFRSGHARLHGTFVKWLRADKRGRHPEENLRPQSALTGDTAWTLFWEVSDLAVLDTPAVLADMRYEREGKPGKKVTSSPERPMLVIA
jgi:hypothetical protein